VASAQTKSAQRSGAAGAPLAKIAGSHQMIWRSLANRHKFLPFLMGLSIWAACGGSIED